MIGLSVSYCIRDIIDGVVKQEDVEKIVGGIRCESLEQHEGVIQQYRKTYWRRRPDEAEEVYRQLLAEGKIEQPHITENRSPSLAGRSHWVESEDEIVWDTN